MQRTLIIETKDLVGKEVNLAGWVNVRRDHGKLIFVDLRDRSGAVQMVFIPSNKELYDLATQLRPEWVISVRGKVKERPEKMINPEIETGKIEIEPLELEIFNKSETPPFPLDTDGYEIGEESRMKYRYLDLRRNRLLKNLSFRHRVIKFIRDYLSEHEFIEVETPIITKATPEGARDYVVPSRLYPGKFYALPQSPQQYKQLLMIAGLEKYFQIARCFRDEDTRGDRQPEFTQLDLEMSFTTQEEVLSLIESLYIKLVETIFPDKNISQKPFPRLSYKEAMEKYNSDKPDVRKDKNNLNEVAFVWITGFPMFEEKEDGSLGATHHPFTLPTYDLSLDPKVMRHSAPEGQKLLKMLESRKSLLELQAYQYDLTCNGFEVGGGSIRIFDRNILRAIFKALGHSDEEFKNKFGHLWEAFSFGVPPHGGIAMGIDRLIAILTNEPNIREVIAFPKTGDARDLMMDSPSELDNKQLKELHLKVEK